MDTDRQTDTHRKIKTQTRSRLLYLLACDDVDTCLHKQQVSEIDKQQKNNWSNHISWLRRVLHHN